MKVKATGEFKRLDVQPKELNTIPEEGKVFEVTEERFNVLSGNNNYNAVFVEKVKEEVKKTAKKAVKEEEEC